MSGQTELCACGKPLHYSDPEIQAQVQHLVDRLGPLLLVRSGARSWMVPRHFIALHGLVARELPTLDFPEVTGREDEVTKELGMRWTR